MTFYYRPMLRPPGFATLPRGAAWTLIARGPGQFPLRSDLPVVAPHGVIAYQTELTPEQLEAFDLVDSLADGSPRTSVQQVGESAEVEDK